MSILRDVVRFGITFVLVSATLCRAQNDKPVLLKAADLQADVVVLRSSYETLHPGLYRYNSKAQMDAAWEHYHDAARHHEQAAYHYKEAAKYDQAEEHEKAMHHAYLAHGHNEHAIHHGAEAAKLHAEDRDSRSKRSSG